VTAQHAVNPARRLAAALEPVIGQVYFAPECHEAYAAMGFGPSPGKAGATALPDGPAYFTSRGSLLGQVPGEVVAAAFAVFNPAAVVPSVAYGWTLTDAPTIRAAREAGAVAQLQRVLGPEPDGVDRAADLLVRMADAMRPEGRPLFAGGRSLGFPDGALARVFRAGDLQREYRGDCHTAAWISAGLDATEIGLLSELYYGLPLKTYVRTRAWSEEQLDDGIERLRAKGLLEGDGYSGHGREVREAIEARTDDGMAAPLAAVGDDVEELIAILQPWGAALRAAGAYLGAGPADLARRGS
jgi:hypothetical protein